MKQNIHIDKNIDNDNENRRETCEIISVVEAASWLGVNRNTLYDAIKKGQVPGVRRIGRVIRICRATVLEWFRGQGPGTLKNGERS